MKATVAALLLVASGAVARADVTTSCYAGPQTSKILLGPRKGESTDRIVIQRTLDPAKSEVRESAWSSKDPSAERVLVATVDVKANTFTAADATTGVTGTGTLVGKAWHWTSQTLTATKSGVDLTIASTLDDKTVHVQMTGTKGGRAVFAADGTLTKFDCAKLAAERAALAPTPAK